MRRKVLILMGGICIACLPLLFLLQSFEIEYSTVARPLLIQERSSPRTDFKMMFVGDVMLSRAIGGLMDKEGDWNYPFRLIKSYLEKADFLFGNLESPISDRGVKSGSIYSFRADPHALAGLTYAGFDAVSLANNHMLDYGPESLLDTVLYLRDVGIGFAGAGEDYESAHKPLYLNVGSATVALLSCTTLLPKVLGATDTTPGVALFDRENTLQEVTEAKTHADIVIVSMHWGNEYETESSLEQKEIAHELIDAGADLVIGHHPHVVQEVEKYKNSYIVYSLGNFVFDQNFSEDTKQGLIFIADVKDKKVDSVSTKTVRFNETYQPLISE